MAGKWCSVRGSIQLTCGSYLFAPQDLVTYSCKSLFCFVRVVTYYYLPIFPCWTWRFGLSSLLIPYPYLVPKTADFYNFASSILSIALLSKTPHTDFSAAPQSTNDAGKITLDNPHSPHLPSLPPLHLALPPSPQYKPRPHRCGPARKPLPHAPHLPPLVATRRRRPPEIRPAARRPGSVVQR